jgi:hypothetical protein
VTVAADLGTLFQQITDAAQSHALASGWFDAVNGHEPKQAPSTHGLTAAVWVDTIRPAPAESGLASTSAVITLNVRGYTSFVAEPADAIDPRLVAATGALMAAYSGDFDLGGTIRNVDLLGQAGTPLSAQAGYLNQDAKIFRVMTITLPCIVSDVWDQVA